MTSYQRQASALAMFLLLLLITGSAPAQTVFATSFFSPEATDPAPGLSGVMKVDLSTGVAEAFISEAVGGLVQPTDVLLGADEQTLFVSSLDGRLWWYDAQTGAPLPSMIADGPDGLFAELPTRNFGDGYTTLFQRGTNEIVAGTAFGSLTPYNLSTGAMQPDLATGLSFPSGLSQAPTGELIAAVGDPFGGPGQIVTIIDGAPTNAFTNPTVSGGSNPTVIRPQGDYDRGGIVDANDYQVWRTDYAIDSGLADANADGATDAADYTVWRDNLGATTRVIVADFFGNRLVGFDLDGSNGEVLATMPPELPSELPPDTFPSNFPSEVLLTEDNTLLVSLQGLTRRPDNRGALLEYDLEGNLLRTIANDLPPISGIAFAPEPAAGQAPEPTAAVLACLGLVVLTADRRR